MAKSNEELPNEEVPVVSKFPEPHEDDRGVIQPLVDRTAQHTMLIRTNAGGIRANHYHKTDWHYCCIIKGSMEYFYRPVGSNEPPKRIVAKAGETVFTPPMVEHAMRYLEEDTTLVCVGNNKRDQESYENDVVRLAPDRVLI